MADPSRGNAPPHEQRAHERLPLQKNALLIARGMNQRACQMKDICAGGALVELREEAPGEGRALRRGEVVLIRVLLGEGSDSRAHEMRARIAHAERQLFGVSFFNPEPAALAALLAAARPLPPPAVPAPLPEAARAQLDRLGKQFLTWSATVFDAFLKATDARLLGMAGHASDEQEQQQFFTAATVLRKRRDEIRNRYLHELRQALRPDAAPLPPAAASQAGAPFDGWLAVRLMAARAEEHFRDALAGLQAGLDAIAPGQSVPMPAFTPATLCAALQGAIAALHLAPPVEKQLQQGFETQVLANLGNVYELLISSLGQQTAVSAPAPGSAPAPSTPKPALPTRPAAVPPPRSAAEYLERAGRPAPGARAPAEGETLAALQQLFALTGPDASAIPAEPLLPVAGAEVKRLFTMLKGANEGWRAALEKLVQHVADPRLAALLPALQQFVADLLQALAADDQLDEAGRGWLQQLELPLLHIVISDPAFFHSDAHPVRQLLAGLLQLGRKGVALAEAQRSLVASWVERINRSVDADLQLYIEAGQALAPLLAAQEKACQRQTERACQSAAAEQRLVDARRQVQAELDARLAGRRVPQPILTLLDAGWRELLVSSLLRGGEAGAEWRDYLGLVDELLAIGADMHRAFDLRRILRLLKTGLLDAGSLNNRQQKQLLDELKHLLSGPQRLVGEVSWTQVPAAPREDADGAGDRTLQKWLARAERLEAGDWLELRQDAGEQCLRLAWRNPDGSRFLFVDRQGVRAASYSRSELAGLMRDGDALGCAREAAAPVAAALEQAGFRLYQRLVERLTHDPLTGLATRAELLRQVERALDIAKRQRVRHVLACIRLDQFSDIHNTARAVAEQLLKGVAELLSRALAPRTLVARLDEDEFALLLEDCELPKAQQLFSMRLGELAALRLNFEGEIYKLTASAGLTELTFASHTAAHALAAAADACADARRHGGNRIQIYQPTAAEQARRDAVMAAVARLNQALEDERLALRCQRMQPLAGAPAESRHYEILLGMRADGSEDWPPSEFVQAAERYNRMLAVDRWVLDSVCRWLRDHPKQAATLGTVSVNLSAQSLQDGQTLSYIFDRLLSYGLPPEKFCFEVSETTAMAHLADTAELMRELVRAGCRFALDDFGVGHAPYRVLHHLPLHYLKIDGALVQAGAAGEGNRQLARATIALARYLGLQTIAENVEDDACREQLQALGVTLAQGYGIERPRWLEEL